MSSKGSLSHGQEGSSQARVIKEVGESLSYVIISLLDTTNLLKISMCSKSIGDNFKPFIGFAKIIASKLDLSKFRSSKEDKSLSLALDIW